MFRSILTIVFLAVPAMAWAQCHPSYEGVCLPVNSKDVDCAGGKGNGPDYAKGPFTRILGKPDPYGLDRDNDGIACEGG